MHLSALPTVATLSMIPEGAAGIQATLKAMSGIVKMYKKNMSVRNQALTLIRGCQQKDFACEVRSLHAFVRDYVRYANDITDVETVQTPDITLQNRAGDCDDKSTLLASLLESIGHPTRFVAIGFEPGIYSHVYVETLIGQNWIPLETTEPVEAGWSPDPIMIKCRKEFFN